MFITMIIMIVIGINTMFIIITSTITFNSISTIIIIIFLIFNIIIRKHIIVIIINMFIASYDDDYYCSECYSQCVKSSGKEGVRGDVTLDHEGEEIVILLYRQGCEGG